METEEILKLLGFVVSLAGGLWGVMRYLLGRIEALDQAVGQKVVRIHERIESVQKEFVRKDELLPHLERIEKAQDRTNQRIDELFRQVMKYQTEHPNCKKALP
ncbi:MAG: hypothetical protein HQK87_11350 [Nitrospinae bacterium]|nr:hypothetical protein [Nitrospinota bacterium]